MVRTGQLPGPVSEYLGRQVDPYKWTYPNCYWRLQVARSSHVLTPSGFARDEIIRFLRVKPERVSVTPLAVHEQFTRPPSSPEVRLQTLTRLGIGRPYLLYVGGFEPHKNPIGLLRCFSKIHTVRSDMTLVAVGSKVLPPELPALAETLGLKPGVDVQFLVDVAADLTDLYDEAALFLSLSWRESFGLPALEAMSRGKPVVTSAWGAGPEVVEGGGISVDPRDEENAAKEVLGLLSHPNPDVLHSRARKAAGRFSWDRTTELTLAVYTELTERGSRRGDAPR
jgi:glycosyltransferase involved in cell wall biosynthesis